MFEMMVGYPPFVASDAAKTCHKIIQWEKNFDIPEDVELSSSSEDLIRKLIDHPEKRLGAGGVQEIKSHPFFRGVNWEGYRSRERAPHRPNLKNDEDVCNFDDFEEDGTWVPADNLRSMRSLAGKKYEHESLFIGYSFKKQVDPQMNRYVEGLVHELRRKNRNGQKRNASQEKLLKGEERRANLEPSNRFKKKRSGNTDTLEVIELENRDIFKTSDAGKRLKRPMFRLDSKTGKESSKLGSHSKLKGFKNKNKNWSRAKKSKQDVKDAEILAGPPRNLTGARHPVKGKLKLNQHMAESGGKLGGSKGKYRISSSKLKTGGKLSSRRLKKPRGEAHGEGSNSSRGKLHLKKSLGVKNSMRPGRVAQKDIRARDVKKKDPKFLDLKKKKFHNVYERGSPGGLRSSKIKSKPLHKIKPKPRVSERKSLKKKLSNEKAWPVHKLKKYKLGTSGKNRVSLGQYSSNKKSHAERLETVPGSPSENMYSKSSTQGFYKRGKRPKKPEANLYYSNVKAKYQNNSARHLEGKAKRGELTKSKPFNSHVKTDADVFKKQYRSNIYDHH